MTTGIDRQCKRAILAKVKQERKGRKGKRRRKRRYILPTGKEMGRTRSCTALLLDEGIDHVKVQDHETNSPYNHLHVLVQPNVP
ncbi:hypothetical protein E2320_007098 [Naja naja]|nr:hypothetical protein E2320_007098 [Naja naja]